MNFSIALNKKMLKAVLLFCALFTFAHAQAVTITWLGGSNDWHYSKGWDLDLVPQVGDIVIIPNGQVTIRNGNTALAKRIEIGTTATLLVEQTAELYVHDAEIAAGITNDGSLEIYGLVDIDHVTLNPNSIANANGIQNNGNCTVYANGTVNIFDIRFVGIENSLGATFKNKGEIFIENVVSRAIRSAGEFKNYGWLQLIVPRLTSTQTYGIVNTGVFKNYSGGDIDIQEASNGMLNWQNGLFYNYGEIETKDITSICVRNENRFYNLYSGKLHIGIGGFGVKNSDRFYNYGELKITNASDVGILNEDRFYNYKKIEITGAAMGIENEDLFKNKGLLKIENTTFESIQVNGGDFNNYPEAQVQVDRRIRFFNNSEFNNGGFITTDYVGINGILMSGATVYNDGVICHPFSTLNSSSNEELFLGSISGVLQKDVPFPNALDLEAWNQVEFLGIYSDAQKTKEVAEFDAKNNTLTPYDEAVGLSTLFFELALDGGDNRLMCQLTLSTPVIPYVINHGNTQFEIATSRITDLNVFPNPTQGEINIEGNILEKTDSQISLLNALGQVVLTRRIPQYEQPNLTLPDNFKNGFYFLHIYQDDKLVGSEKIQVVR